MINPIKLAARLYWSARIAIFIYRNPWVGWIAVDEEGWFYAFKSKPCYHQGCWVWGEDKTWCLIGNSCALRRRVPKCLAL